MGDLFTHHSQRTYCVQFSPRLITAKPSENRLLGGFFLEFDNLNTPETAKKLSPHIRPHISGVFAPISPRGQSNSRTRNYLKGAKSERKTPQSAPIGGPLGHQLENLRALAL
jgi:hypothetical protein